MTRNSWLPLKDSTLFLGNKKFMFWKGSKSVQTMIDFRPLLKKAKGRLKLHRETIKMY